MRRTVIARFHDLSEAKHALRDLGVGGFRSEDTRLMIRPEDHVKQTAESSTGTKAGQGLGLGAITGAALGGLGGWLFGMGALTIPGLGPAAIMGPLWAAMTGAGLGAATGGSLGALAGLSVPNEKTLVTTETDPNDAILVTVETETPGIPVAESVLRRNGAHDIRLQNTRSRANSLANVFNQV